SQAKDSCVAVSVAYTGPDGNPSPRNESLGIPRLNFTASLQHALSYTTHRSVIRQHTAASDFISGNPLVEIKPNSRIERLLSDTKSWRHSLCSTPHVEREGRNERQTTHTLPSENNDKASCLDMEGGGEGTIRPSLQSVGHSALSTAFFPYTFFFFLSVDFGVIFETPDSERF
ncbi:hypothetical protein NPIL_695911, partial [Nephila pilipes]